LRTITPPHYHAQTANDARQKAPHDTDN